MKRYNMTDILNSEFHDPPCIIDQLVWEQDNIILLGAAKSSKSILLQQLGFSASSGEPFLDQYKVHKKCKVAMFQAEGKMPETISRCQKMAKEIPIIAENFLWFHVPGIAMNKPETPGKIIELLGDFKPDIMMFDPLYKMKSGGSLKDDDVAGDITQNMDILKDKYECTMIIAHHEHRIKIDTGSGKIIEEGDNAIFGSFVWQAWPDHILLLKKNTRVNEKARTLSCATQRSANVIEKLELQLIEPDPLLFEIREDTGIPQKKIMQYLAKNFVKALHYDAIAKGTDLAIPTVLKSLRTLIRDNIVVKTAPGMYILKEAMDNHEQ